MTLFADPLLITSLAKTDLAQQMIAGTFVEPFEFVMLAGKKAATEPPREPVMRMCHERGAPIRYVRYGTVIPVARIRISINTSECRHNSTHEEGIEPITITNGPFQDPQATSPERERKIDGAIIPYVR